MTGNTAQNFFQYEQQILLNYFHKRYKNAILWIVHTCWRKEHTAKPQIQILKPVYGWLRIWLQSTGFPLLHMCRSLAHNQVWLWSAPECSRVPFHPHCFLLCHHSADLEFGKLHWSSHSPPGLFPPSTQRVKVHMELSITTSTVFGNNV